MLTLILVTLRKNTSLFFGSLDRHHFAGVFMHTTSEYTINNRWGSLFRTVQRYMKSIQQEVQELRCITCNLLEIITLQFHISFQTFYFFSVIYSLEEENIFEVSLHETPLSLKHSATITDSEVCIMETQVTGNNEEGTEMKNGITCRNISICFRLLYIDYTLSRMHEVSSHISPTRNSCCLFDPINATISQKWGNWNNETRELKTIESKKWSLKVCKEVDMDKGFNDEQWTYWHSHISDTM